MFGWRKNDEAEMKARLLSGNATLEEGLKLYNSMTGRGESFGPELEEAVLRLGLAKEPDRPDLISRMRYVLSAQGKPIPEYIEKAFADHTIRQEQERDHQKDAYEYHQLSDHRDMDPDFLLIYEQCRSYSMTSIERMYSLYQSVKYIINAGISGDFVECGVWRGGSMMTVAKTLTILGVRDRELYLFDTYEGLPKPDIEKDIDIWGNRAIDGWLPLSVSDEKSHWAEASLDDVETNLISTGYPQERMHFVKGLVENTLPASAPASISLLRLDTDWYASTKHELTHLYPLLTRGGVLIIDDYGHFKGAKIAVDEYFHASGNSILLNRIDYSGRLGIKIK